MLLATTISILGIGDIYYLIKSIKKFRQLSKAIKYLQVSEHLNVSDVIKLFQNQPTGAKLPVIIKGILKSKPENTDRNILSLITSTTINKSDQLQQYKFQRIPFRQVLTKAFWARPQQFKNISCDLKDLKSIDKVSIESCKNTDFFGVLSDIKSFQVIKNTGSNRFIQFFKSLANSIMFLSPIKFNDSMGQKITYYGIMNNSFGYVVGEAKKQANGKIIIQNPKYLTKQISFILKRLKQNAKIFKFFLLLYLFVQVLLVYYIGKWVFKKFGNNLRLFNQQQEQKQQDVPFHQACIICYSNPRSVIFKPCKHYGLCFGCYQRIGQQKVCPVCKQPIEGIIRVIKKK